MSGQDWIRNKLPNLLPWVDLPSYVGPASAKIVSALGYVIAAGAGGLLACIMIGFMNRGVPDQDSLTTAAVLGAAAGGAAIHRRKKGQKKHDQATDGDDSDSDAGGDRAAGDR